MGEELKGVSLLDYLGQGLKTLKGGLRFGKPDFEASSQEKEREKAGIYSTARGLLIETPLPGFIDRIISKEPRIEYVPSRIPGEILDVIDLGDGEKVEKRLAPRIINPGERFVLTPELEERAGFYELVNKFGIGQNLLDKVFTIPFLEQRIKELFGDRELVGVRGSACSINIDKEIYVGGKKIRNILEIMQLGVENGQDYAAMTSYNLTKSIQIGDRSIQWLMDHPNQLRKKMEKLGNYKDASYIFPVLLVYDRSKFPKGTTILPTSPIARSEVILKAFIIDCPIK